MPNDPKAEGEAQVEIEEQTTEEAAEAPARPGFTWRRLVGLAGVTAVAFLVSGVIALGVGGHFRREPLNSLRGLPLVGRLVPAPEAEPEPEVQEPPNVAAVHPMPATEIGELIGELQAMRGRLKGREQRLGQGEERLKALQVDLRRERDVLEQLMEGLEQRQAALAARREALEADVVVARAEERKRLTQLARIYEAQEATAAASELAALSASGPDGMAVKILASMTEKKAAPIFDAMPPEAAAALKTQLLRLRFEVGTKKEGAS